MIYTLTLSSGKVLSGLKMNGGCFVSKTEVKAEDFSGGLKKVIVHGVGDTPEEQGIDVRTEMICCTLGDIFTVDGEYYFWLNIPSEQELESMKARADVDYLALMTGVEL